MTSSSFVRAVVAATACAACLPCAAQDAPLFARSFEGVPIPNEQEFRRIVPLDRYNPDDDHLRALQVGGDPGGIPPNLPPRFTETVTTPSTTGMTIGGAYFGQFVDHDLDLTRERFDQHLIEPFVRSYAIIEGHYENRRTPGFDLDSLYRITPIDFPWEPEGFGPWDPTDLRFRFFVRDGNADFSRPNQGQGQAIIGDPRNDVTGLTAQIHMAFMRLHNMQVNRIAERENIDLYSLERGSDLWWDVFNEARNYVTAYYQGIICNEFVEQLTGRTLFEAMDDQTHPAGPMDGPYAMLEFAEGGYRLHTMIPAAVRINETTWVSPIDQRLRNGVPWEFLIGEDAAPASRLDAGVATTMREIVDLFIPGIPLNITLDLSQVNILRGREVAIPGGEDYLAFLTEELGIEPKGGVYPPIRGKQVLTAISALAVLDPILDTDLLVDLANGDTDLWAYIMIEAELNGGVLGPVGQDIIERTWINLLLADDWSLVGSLAGEFSPEQMEFFRTATLERLVSEIDHPADVNGDGYVTARDLVHVLGNWGATDSYADVDGNGTVGKEDLSLILGNWGQI